MNHPWYSNRTQPGSSKLRQVTGIATIAKYTVHHPKPPSQTWRSFLDNHVNNLVSGALPESLQELFPILANHASLLAYRDLGYR